MRLEAGQQAVLKEVVVVVVVQVQVQEAVVRVHLVVRLNATVGREQVVVVREVDAAEASLGPAMWASAVVLVAM